MWQTKFENFHILIFLYMINDKHLKKINNFRYSLKNINYVIQDETKTGVDGS